MAEQFDVNLINQKIEEFSNKVFSTIKLVDNTVVILDFYNEITDGTLNYNSILSAFHDYTGFEASHNEMRISDYIDIQNIIPVPFLFRLIKRLKFILNHTYPQYKFVILGFISNDKIEGTETTKEMEIRFHVLRNDEMLWLDDDIDKYENAIVVCSD